MLEFSAIKEEVTEERWEIHAKWSDWMIMDTIEISFLTSRDDDMRNHFRPVLLDFLR